ncbi:hypothetical protein [Achromobacter sp. MYb9]|uniref:hypothetical protein n=1 Tax=Achromobacter sp. MYb9 TaxID=1827284 RepID=UPI0011B23A2F|nr:hypothetical protein [Achromobacter sp. MYb9]
MPSGIVLKRSFSIGQSYQRFLIANAMFLAISICTAETAVGKSLDIYLAPKGVDTASGLSADAPIASVARAQELVAEKASGYDEVRVLFAPGVYRGQGVEWRTFPGIWTRFMPARPGTAVVFDGQGGKQSVFFKALPGVPTGNSAPVSMKLEFTGLTFQRYCEALSFQSWSDDVRRPGGRDVVVTRSNFVDIGSKFDPVRRGKLPRGGCTAALRLQGVGHGRVEGNSFKNIINLDNSETALKTYGRGHLHSIYISNMSQGNEIVGNKFDDFSGDPIRIRDQSDRNRISGNIFGSASDNTKPGDVHAISQWYCNDGVKACVERQVARKECASEDLELRDNRIEGRNVENYADRSQGKATCAK